MSSINWSGLLSGDSSSSSIAGKLDVQYIVDSIIESKRDPIRTLETYETLYNAKKTAFQELNTLVSAVESSLYTLKSSGFNSNTATSSNEDILGVSASTTAQAGNYSIIVGQLARAQSNTSTGYSSTTDLVLAEGTTFQITQDGVTKTIDITGQTRSLGGLKNAINNLGVDVSATLLYDGTNYKLQVTADETGTAKAFTINDTAGGAVGTSMSTPKLTALDAEIYVNSPVAPEDKITRSSNTISDVIAGVTLNLNKADTASTVTAKVDTNTTALRDDIGSFVTAFNAAIDYLNTQFTYNEDKARAGVLSGESTARKVQSDLLSLVSSRVQGLTAGDDDFSSMAIIGLTIDDNGQLLINDEKMDDALTGHLDAVKRIFLDVGTSTNSQIGYVGHGNSTVAGTYSVAVTQIAEQASVQASYEMSGGGIAQDETLTFSYNGADYKVNLTTGMTLSEVVSTVNSFMDENDLVIAASASGNTLKIGTEAYGSEQTVSVVSNVAAASGGTGIGTTKLSDSGLDVAGTIGGETASGKGQLLTSTAGDANGLMVLVNTTMLGDQGEVYATFGIGEQLRQQMYDITLPYEGLIAKSIGSLDTQLDNISDRIDAINEKLSKEYVILIQQYSTANEALVQLEYLQSTLSNSIVSK